MKSLWLQVPLTFLPVLVLDYGAIFIHKKKSINRIATIASVVIFICFPFFLVITNILKYYANWEHAFINISETQSGMQLGHMSLITALLFIFTGFALLFLQSSRKRIKALSIILTIIVLMVSFIFLLAYGFGTPFFYLHDFIPPAVLTVLSFLLVSLGLIAAYDKNTFLVRKFWATSTSAKLFRIFLPTAITITVLEGLIIIRILPLINIHPAIGVSLVSLIVVAVLVIVISIISKNMGKALDSALDNLSESEERFHRAITYAPYPIMIHADGKVLQLSEEWTKQSGYTIEDIPTIKEWTSRAYGENAIPSQEFIDNLYKIDKKQYDGEWKVKIKDGSYRLWDFSSSPIGKLPNGKKIAISMASDITDRKQALEQIEMLSKMPSENPSPVFRVKQDGTVLYANNSASLLLQAWKCSIGEKFPLFLCDLIYKIYQDITVKEIEYNVDGYIFLLVIVPIVDSGLLNIYGRDITERKLAEEALRINEDNLNLIINASPIGICTVNELGDFIMTNPAYEQMVGYTKKEFMSLSFFDITHPNDRPKNKKLFQNMFSQKTKGSFSMEKRYLCKNGNEINVYINAVDIRDAEGNNKFGVAFIEDITERRQNQQQLDYLLTLQNKLRIFSTDLINIDSDKISEAFNDILKEIGHLYGADRAYIFEYDFKNKTVTEQYEWCAEGVEPQIDMYHKIELPILAKGVIAHLAGLPIRVSSIDDEPEGYTREVLTKIQAKSILTVPTFLDNELVGFVGVDYVKNEHAIKDIDVEIMRFFGQIYTNTMARMKSENELKELNTQLISTTKIAHDYAEKSKQSSKAKSEFLATMSHEIRTPLNGVIGFTDLLAETELNITQKSYMENASKSAHSLLNIISDVLDFSKIEAGKLELEYIECDIYQLFDEIIDLVKIRTSKKGIELLVNIDLNLPQTVIIDAGRFRQVMVNLLSNAVKFTFVGYIKLVVGFEEVNDKGLLSVKVMDSGVGVNKQESSKLFKAFSQADASVTRKFGGTGLGLIISNNIIHQMGGNIEFSSIPNVLTTFEFLLEVEFIKGKRFNQGITKNINKILLIESESSKISSIRRMLLFWNYNVTVAHSFDEAIEAMNNDKFGLLFVGYILSIYKDSNELKLTRNSLNITKTPVLFVDEVIANQDLSTECEKLDIGFLISKPIRPTNLSKKLIDIDKNLDVGFKPHSAQMKVKKEHKMLSKNKYRILIAEDNQLNLKLLTIILKQLLPNIYLDSAKNGKIARDKAIKNGYDLILMDLQMPEMGGIASTKLIIEALNCKTPPIIALTANATNADKANCLEAGMVGFLTKPIIRQSLIDVLRGYLFKK